MIVDQVNVTPRRLLTFFLITIFVGASPKIMCLLRDLTYQTITSFFMSVRVFKLNKNVLCSVLFHRRYRYHNHGRLPVFWKFQCPKLFAAHDLTNALKNWTIVISFWSNIWVHDGLWITLVRYKVFEKLYLYGAVCWCFTSAWILNMFDTGFMNSY